jgi:hypothetical protein
MKRRYGVGDVVLGYGIPGWLKGINYRRIRGGREK